MRRGLTALVVALLAACGGGEDGDASKTAVPGRPGMEKSTAAARAARRAYDGAPPVAPHEDFGVDCMQCHNERGIEVAGLGFAPPMPHEITDGISALSNCKQCHLFRRADDVFRPSSFEGEPQALELGHRAHDFAPPVIPHPLFLRENCLACHDGPAAREELRCSHPERAACTQCHLHETAGGSFARE